MRFIDEVNIQISSGNGGDGRVSFRREKFIPFGGPDGGNGGDGGSIIFKGDNNLNTLQHFRGPKNFKAKDGQHGFNKQRNGPFGEDLILRVPLGTLIKDQETKILLADLTSHDQEILLASGGRGGLGNFNFKSSINQAPRHAGEGRKGSTLNLELELKLLAHIALIGLPNAGKSTLISVLSKAKPKIADYPFTTLGPHLGVLSYGENTLVIADIPGLIEGASDGRGLGIKFLKHIERTQSFLHLIDCSSSLDPFDIFQNYVIIRTELEKHRTNLLDKKEIICLTKTDVLPYETVKKIQTYMEGQLGKKIIPLSAVSGYNLELLKSIIFKTKE